MKENLKVLKMKRSGNTYLIKLLKESGDEYNVKVIKLIESDNELFLKLEGLCLTLDKKDDDKVYNIIDMNDLSLDIKNQVAVKLLKGV